MELHLKPRYSDSCLSALLTVILLLHHWKPQDKVLYVHEREISIQQNSCNFDGLSSPIQLFSPFYLLQTIHQNNKNAVFHKVLFLFEWLIALLNIRSSEGQGWQGELQWKKYLINNIV